MKLNYKKTIYVGLAFFIITIFWQTYDSVIARILINKFGMNQFWSGVVMALDNIFALLLLPVFGAMSDRSKNKRGRRTPFIIVGTVIGAFAFMLLSVSDSMQTVKLEKIDMEGTYGEALIANADNPLYATYESNYIRTEAHWIIILDAMDTERKATLGETSKAYETFKNEILDPIANRVDNDKNTDGLIEVRDFQFIKEYYNLYLSERAWEITVENPFILILFLGTLLIALLAMSFYRSPAVALMPDVTIKPLRSKGNAIINLMGSGAAIVTLGFLMASGRSLYPYIHYHVAFIFTGVVMLAILAIFLWKVKEPKLVLEKEAEDLKYGLTENIEVEKKHTVLSKEAKVSLILILSSIFLWFMGYNAVMSKVSDYTPKMLNMDASLPPLIGNISAIIAFIPIGIISSKIGRKLSILIGVVIVTLSFAMASFVTEDTVVMMYLVFFLIGVGWATINVNSLPMVVELSTGADVGKYTGYYYTFSMAAQIVTPMLSGLLIDAIDYSILFPYAAVFVGLSFITMLFVKHGNAQKIEVKSKLDMFEDL